MNVYVVHWGEYSDSGIVGVFAKREDAEAWPAAGWEDDMEDGLASDTEPCKLAGRDDMRRHKTPRAI